MKKSHFLIFRPVSLRENYWVFHYKINDVEKEKSPSPIEYWLMLSFLRGQNWWENMTKPVCSVPESEFGCLQHATIHQKGANILGNVNIKGLHKLWNPAILDGRTRSKCGEPGKYDLKHSIYDSKHSICDSKYSICQPDDSKHYILRHLWWGLKNS